MTVLRAFIPIELPDEIRERLEQVTAHLKEKLDEIPVRWVPVGNIHLTLKFLGQIRENQVEAIDQEIKNTLKHHFPFKLQAKGVGVFPSIKRPRVLWVGLSGQINRLLDLQKQLELGLEQLGFPLEKRSYKGHLTVGRIKDRIEPQKMITAIKESSRFQSCDFVVQNVTFFKSDLKQTGAEYTRLTRSAIRNPQ